MAPDEPSRKGKVAELFVYDNFVKKAVDFVEAGDICALSGLADVGIGETVADPRRGVALPKITVEEPTVRMSFLVNTSPFAGREGKFVTSRNLRDRLFRELERNLAMRVETGETADEFIVCGRGTLHLGILIENMRREGYEFMVGPPRVILKKGADGENLEPYEDAVVEVPEEYVGAATVLLGGRNGQMVDMSANEYSTTIKYHIPTRGLLGMRNAILSATRGTAVLTTVFGGYGPYLGPLSLRENGSLVSMEPGMTTTYALMMCQERGALFVRPGVEVYNGQVIGAHQRPGDLELNAARAKRATNIRAASKVGGWGGERGGEGFVCLRGGGAPPSLLPPLSFPALLALKPPPRELFSLMPPIVAPNSNCPFPTPPLFLLPAFRTRRRRWTSPATCRWTTALSTSATTSWWR